MMRFFKRKHLLIFGHLGMGINHLLIGYLNTVENSTGVIVNMGLFMWFYGSTSGPLAWAIAAETVVDKGLGVCLTSLYLWVIILSLICPVIMDPEVMGPSNVFYFFSVISFLAIPYVIYFMKETKGLTDKQKKNLYYNKDQ